MLIRRTHFGGSGVWPGPASRVVSDGSNVEFILWDKKYWFESDDEYSIKLRDDGTVVEEFSGVILEPGIKTRVIRNGWYRATSIIIDYCAIGIKVVLIAFLFYWPLTKVLTAR
jgi:hypothetical protein